MPVALSKLHRLTMEKLTKRQAGRPPGITVVAILMILFGLAEIVTWYQA